MLTACSPPLPKCPRQLVDVADTLRADATLIDPDDLKVTNLSVTR